MGQIVDTYVLEAKNGERFVVFTDEGKELYWPEVVELLRLCEPYGHGEVLAEDLRGLTFFGLFSPHRLIGVVGVEKVIYPRFHCARIVAIAGEGFMDRGWVRETFTRWAKATGAKYVEGYAREAMVRYWRRLGGFSAYTVVRKEL